MALTELQRSVCRLIARNRVASGESYVAGAVALNELLGAARVSRDIDLFHDTEAAVDAAWIADRALLEADGFAVRAMRERPGFVEAEIRRAGQTVLMQWARDSAFRFFPLVEHPELGLTLDALVRRRESGWPGGRFANRPYDARTAPAVR